MAHFARLNADNIVTEVIVVNNDVIRNEPFPESEPIGIDFCRSLFGADTNWAQTSYSASFRYNYAGTGFTFDPTATPDGAFIPPQPYASWVLTPSFQWEAPVPYPDDGNMYVWNEETLSWQLVTE